MPRTRDQVIQQVLDIVNQNGAGESYDAEDVKLVDNIIDPAIAMLRRLGVIDISDNQSFDEETFLPFATYLTAFIPALVTPDPNVIVQAQNMLAELGTDDVVGTVEADYF